MIRKITFLLPALLILLSHNLLAQTCPPITTNSDTCDYYNHITGTPATLQNPCQASVPHFCVDFTNNPSGVFQTPPTARTGNCCGTSSPDRCIDFELCVGPNTAAVRLEICNGAVPPGSLFFQVNCGPLTNILELGCISGQGFYNITFCKPGNNVNQYCLISIPRPTNLPDDSLRIGCFDTLKYSGVHATGSTWTSIFPGAPGAYDSYLSAPFPSVPDSSSTVVITPLAGAPAFVDYRVCGTAVADDCLGPATFCDTVRIYFFSSLSISMADTANYCAAQGGVNLCPVYSGGAGGNTYIWRDSLGSTLATTGCYFAPVPGLYTIEVNDILSSPGDCGPARDTVRVLLDSINIIESHTNATCFGDCDGTITLVTVGGTPPYTYLWNDAVTTQNRTGLCAGTYTVTVTDNGAGCIGTFTIVLTQPAVLVASIDSVKNVGCNGEMNGAVYLQASGGTNPLTYQWSSGQTTEDITNLPAGTYTVTVTDANGCTTTVSAIVTQPAIIVPLITNVSINGNDVSCWLAADDTSCAGVTGGTPPYTYHWTPGDSTTQCITGMGGGVLICVTVTDANGCTGEACHSLSQPDSLYLTVDAVSTYFGGYNITCNGFSDGSIDIGTSGGTPPYVYDWSDIPGVAPPGPDEGEDRTGIIAGTYTITVTDLNNCTATISVTLSEPVVLYDSIASPLTPGGYNIQCKGECNATISTNTTGGTPPYTYQWTPNVSSGNSASGLCAGSYTVTVTDVNGCSFTDTLTLTEPDTVLALITLVIVNNGSPITCNSVCDGTAFVTASGGSPPYNYIWNYPPASTPTFSADSDTIYNVCAGDISVIVYDTNGCSASDTTTMTEPPLLSVSVSAVTFVAGWNEPCFGDCLDTATATPSGGTSPYTYLWSNAQITQDATGLCAATYTVTATDANGCTATADITLFEPPVLTASLIAGTFACGENVSCTGACDGSIDLTVSGGTDPMSFLWSNSDVTEDINNLCAGTYTVTVTDANGCTATQSITLTSPTPVVIDSLFADTCFGGWNICCNGGANGCMHVVASGGCPAYTYLWTLGYNTADVCAVSVFTYVITVSDANGCAVMDSITLTEPQLLTDTLIAIEYDTTNISCNGACDGSITATPAGGTAPYSYLWSNGCITQTCSSLCAGTYYVTITDANACETNDSITLDEPPLPLSVFLTNTGIACDTACTNTIAAHPSGGTAPYTYCWSSSGPAMPCPGPDSLSNICIAAYTVLVTDLNGCTATASFTFSSAGTPISITLTSTNNSCNAACNDTITATPTTGTPPYTYTWTPAAPNSPNYYGACIGTYTVTVTDVNGCSGTNSITLISSPVVITMTFTGSNYNGWGVTCNGACDGSITANPTSGLSPYTYLWSNAATTQTISALCAGTYTVTVTDANGCTGSDSYTITEPPLLTVSLAGSIYAGGWGVSCNGACDDTLTTTPTGGTAPYLYTWSNGGPNSPIQPGLCAGTYTVTVTDVNGCTASANFTVTEPPVLIAGLAGSIYAGGWGVSCNGACDDTLTASASGGTSPYNYAWSNGGPNSIIQTGICAGTFTVTVTDANGCTASANFTVTEPPVLVAGLSGSLFTGGWGVSCNGACDDTLTATASGGTSPYSYTWSNAGPNSPNQTGICAGTYTVTVTDSNGCTASANFTVTEPPVLNVNLSPTSLACDTACTNSLTANASGGTAPYTYCWSSSGPAVPCPGPASITNLCIAAYTVTVTDVNGCTVSASFTFSPAGTPINVTLASTNNSCNAACNDTITSTVLSGTPPYTYTWTPAAPNSPNYYGACIGTYTVTVTDANGCSGTASITLVSSPVVINISFTVSNYNGSGVSCNGACDGSITATPTTGLAPYTYLWSNAATTQTISALCAGVYTVTVTDVNGCTGTGIQVITEPPVLTTTISTLVFAGGWNEPCFGDCLDTLTANPSGGTAPYNYVWSTSVNDTLQSNPNLCAGTYTVTVTDANNCTATASFTVTEPPVLAVALSGSIYAGGWGVSCNGACDDTLSAAPSGGTPPYSYTWSNGGPNNPVQPGICAGTYTVTVTDANNCTASASFIVTEPPLLAISLSGSIYAGGWGVSCNGACDDTLTSNTAGGTLPYNYTWSNGGPNAPGQTGICAGTYTVTVTDANNCTASASFIVTEPPLLTASLTGSIFAGGWGVSCNGACDDTLSAAASGGTSPYAYTWSNGGPNNSNQTGICAGTYTVTVTDANNCTASASFIVTEPPMLSVVLTDTLLNPPYNNSCPTSCDGWLLATPSGGTPAYSYNWSNGNITAKADSLCGGFYTVTVTDANGCTVVMTDTITDPAQPQAVAGPDQDICDSVTTLLANVHDSIYTAYWYVVSGSATFSPDSLSDSVFVSGLSWGTNVLVRYVGDTMCIARDTIIIQSTHPVTADAGRYPDICEGDEPIHLHADPNYTGMGTWTALPIATSPITFDNSNDPNTWAHNFGWNSNTIVWTVVDGPCSAADTVRIIKLIPEVCDSSLLEMPTGFSPNKDGHNDNFVIHGIEFSFNRQNTFIVFNRWGNEVFSKENYWNDWYGQNKDGGLLSDGTYFVILTITNPGPNQGRVLKGYVDMRR